MYTPSSSINSQGQGSREAWVAELQKRGSDEPEQIVDAYIKYSPLGNKNYDLLIGQGIKESAGFTDYKWIEYRNPAGIGSTTRQAQGVIFDSIEAGITAQISHACAYADTPSTCPMDNLGDEYANLFNDPRHDLVGHQGHPEIAWWDGHWAVPGNGYAQGICDIVNAVVGDVPSPVDPPKPHPPTALNIVDIIDELTTNPNGGPGYDFDDKVGIIWHYNGPPPNNDAHTQYINDSAYHVSKGWGVGGAPPYGDGIMYHYGIGYDHDGKPKIFRLRRESAVLWHCGAWVPGGNESGIAINVNIGEGENADPEIIGLASALGDEIRARRNIAFELCKGHQEVSPTACPGTLMDDLVIPYRAGQLGGTVPPVVTNNAIHENNFIIAGGFKSIVDALEGISHAFRMRMLGYCLSNEGDGYLCSPETLTDGSTTGRFHIKKVVIQKFERNTLVHDATEPNAEWQDTVALENRGWLVGFADDPAINAILENKSVQTTLSLHRLAAKAV